MSFWQIIIPQQAQNLVTIPSVTNASGSTGYTAAGASIAPDYTVTRRGCGSIKVTPTAALNDGLYWTVNLTSGVTYYFSVDVFGASNVPYRVFFGNAGSTPVGTAGSFSGTAYWQGDRPVATYTPGSSGPFRVYVAKNNSASTSPFWVDGFMVQTAGSNCTYIDGNQAGCSWDAGDGISTSTLSGTSREGGLIVDFDTAALAISDYTGVGMPPINNVLLQYGLQDGSYYQRSQASQRTIKLKGSINTSLQPNPTWQTLHQNRRELIDYMKHDLLNQDQAFWLRYTGGNSKPMWIKTVYQDGLDAELGNTGFVENINLTLTAPDPFFYEDGNNGFLSAGSAVTGPAGFLAIKDAVTKKWKNLPSISDKQPVCNPVQDTNGNIYFAMGAGGSTQSVQKWDGTSWSVLGYVNSGQILSIAIGPDNTIYIGGTFTSIAGVAASDVAKWNGSTWSAMGNGFNGGPSSLAVWTDGNVYASGLFTTTATGSTLPTPYFMKWNGSAWVAPTSGSLNGYAQVMRVGIDGYLYMAGTFTTYGGSACVAVGKYNGTTITPLVTTGTPSVIAMACASDGSVYVGGSFSAINGISANNIAKWNGSGWAPLGLGIIAQPFYQVNYISEMPDGNILVSAYNISSMGGIPSGLSAALWNGSSWCFPNALLNPGGPTFGDLTDKQGNFWHVVQNAGGSSAGVTIPAYTTLQNNGNASTQITVKFIGPGTVYTIENATTGCIVYFNLTLMTGETAVLNLTPGYATFTSNYRGNILNTIIPGSDLTSFKVLPGANIFGAFSTLGANSVQVKWEQKYWSIDGGA